MNTLVVKKRTKNKDSGEKMVNHASVRFRIVLHKLFTTTFNVWKYQAVLEYESTTSNAACCCISKRSDIIGLQGNGACPRQRKNSLQSWRIDQEWSADHGQTVQSFSDG